MDFASTLKEGIEVLKHVGNSPNMNAIKEELDTNKGNDYYRLWFPVYDSIGRASGARGHGQTFCKTEYGLW
jgi:hypothetical protein